jgi:hypothetical protein
LHLLRHDEQHAGLLLLIGQARRPTKCRARRCQNRRAFFVGRQFQQCQPVRADGGGAASALAFSKAAW